MTAAPPATIIYVPGKNPKPPEEIHHRQLWQCLHEGIRRVDPLLAAELARDPDDVLRLAPWNPLFYHTTREPGPEQPWIERLLQRPRATDMDRGQAGNLITLTRRWVLRIANRFPRLARPLASSEIRATLLEVDRYFSNRRNVGAHIRSVLRAELERAHREGRRIAIIGHSLGSVIAWDTLWELSREMESPIKVDLFLTMGSPLGLRFIQRQLLGAHAPSPHKWPGNIRRWVNITAVGDMTALDPTVANDFHAMLAHGLVESIEDHRREVYTWYRDADGLNVHRAYGYLLHPATASTLALWWRQTGIAPGSGCNRIAQTRRGNSA